MTHTPHELLAEFPEHADAIHRLKAENAHFAKLFDEYHALNRSVHRAETNVEPVDEFSEHKMRKERMALKDALWALIREDAKA
jgi:uncharacterized protein YdcH (DUF465 family)